MFKVIIGIMQYMKPDYQEIVVLMLMYIQTATHFYVASKGWAWAFSLCPLW
jgi:hypothetical protein